METKWPSLPKENSRGPSLTEEQIERGRSLFLDGRSERYVAAAIGTSRSTAVRWCKPDSLEAMRAWEREYYARNGKSARTDPKKRKEADKRRYARIKENMPEEFEEFKKKFRPVAAEYMRRKRAKKDL